MKINKYFKGGFCILKLKKVYWLNLKIYFKIFLLKKCYNATRQKFHKACISQFITIWDIFISSIDINLNYFFYYFNVNRIYVDKNVKFK